MIVEYASWLHLSPQKSLKNQKRITIYCSSVLAESLCPTCLKKRQQVNQTYQRPIRDLSITGKEGYLYLTQRQFYCPDCNRHFTERFSFVESGKTMTKGMRNTFMNFAKTLRYKR